MKIEKQWIYADLTEKQAKITGAVWNEKTELYRLPNTIGVLQELYKMGYKETKEILAAKNKQRNHFIHLKKLEDAAGDKRLRPYQRVDVNYLKKIGSAGIFNEQRTGKTPTTLVLAEEAGYKKIVVVCPASLVLNWKSEVEKWTSFRLVPVSGAKKTRMNKYTKGLLNNDGFIVSYETLRSDISELVPMVKMSGLDCLIVDEAHRLRSLTKGRKASKTAKAVNVLGYHANVRYALTGTPVVKEGQEIWGILHFLYPERFPGYWQFVDRYFEVNKDFYNVNHIGSYKRKRELQDILSIISVNRKRREVMNWLPKKQYKKIRLEPNAKQLKVYNDVRETFEYEDIIDAPSVLAQTTRLRQIATCPEILVDNVPNEKEKFILEWIEDNPKEPVVIFSTFSSYLEKLHKKLKGSAMITGSVTRSKRDQVVRDFQNGKCNILLCNIKAAGVGLTLDRAETIIFLDKEYNPSDNEQAEDRIVPVSKERNHNMYVISLVIEDTVDEMIHDLLRRKVDITKVINDGGIQSLERLWKEGQREREVI